MFDFNFTRKDIAVSELENNKGQVYGLPKNPRFIKDDRFAKLCKSITDDPEYMEIRELVVWLMDNDKYIVLGGNMRLRACTQLGWEQIPCKILPKETPVAKLRAYAIKDNEQFGNTDWDILANEWDTEELQSFGVEMPFFDGSETEELPEEEKKDETEYSRKIEIPTYGITGKEPSISECVDTTALNKLLKQIDESNVTKEQKEMLRICAYRHAVIHFDNMAEYYAHQNKDMQFLMEEQALVIIDFDRAIEKGFVDMTQKLLNLIPSNGNDDLIIGEENSEENESRDVYDEE